MNRLFSLSLFVFIVLFIQCKSGQNEIAKETLITDKILKFAIHPDIKAVALIKLPEGHYESICVSADDSVVYASNGKSNTIEKYQFD